MPLEWTRVVHHTLRFSSFKELNWNNVTHLMTLNTHIDFMTLHLEMMRKNRCFDGRRVRVKEYCFWSYLLRLTCKPLDSINMGLDFVISCEWFNWMFGATVRIETARVTLANNDGVHLDKVEYVVVIKCHSH